MALQAVVSGLLSVLKFLTFDEVSPALWLWDVGLICWDLL